MENKLTEKEKEFAEILKSIVEWWECWENSPNPTEMENPPIEKAKAILLEHGINTQSQSC